MGWLRKRASKTKPLAQHQDKIAGSIAHKILALQKRTAAKLNGKAQKIGKTNVICLLGATLIGFAGYLVYIIINAIFYRSNF
ncbi:hypothetical protein QWY86_15730 [Pedobacter aquatilis]|uniref:hypothetical protein n=1 Tax=Pedobacter aquatilis TaxID=351343 RepID=UPI0025B5BA55|nr:hypothetical protein [Pedobacter aquatilis]MDN3588134.1 hypothetical protein [Pedobacter aquatilis]